MGNRFEFCVMSDNNEHAQDLLEQAVMEVQRIENLLTTFKESSITNQINKQAGLKPVVVDDETFHLIHRSIKMSELTQGAFDISYGSIDKSLWNFDTTITSLPDPEVAKKSVDLIDYHNIILNPKEQTVLLRRKGMRIGFGGIGKGYAADRVKQMLQSKGVSSGIVNAAGDLAAWGVQPTGKPWTIGIADPDRAHLPFSYLDMTNRAIATSGNYEKVAIINGKPYSHTIDPKTGMPVSGIKSVTIISSSAEFSDAIATPVMVMGVKVGLNLINQMKDVECIIINDKNQLFASKNVNIMT